MTRRGRVRTSRNCATSGGRSRAGTQAVALLLFLLLAVAVMGRETPPANPLWLLGTRLHDGATRDVLAQPGWRLVVFWSTDCEPCVEQLRSLGPVLRATHRSGIDVVTVALDTEMARPAARTWIDRLALPVEWAFVVPPNRLGDRVDRRLGLDLRHLPHVVLIGPDEGIAWQAAGRIDPGDIMAATAKVVGDTRAVERALGSEDEPPKSKLDPWLAKLMLPTGDGGTVELTARLEATCRTYASQGDVRGEAVCSAVLSMLWLSRRNFGQARLRLEKARDGFEAVDDPMGRWLVLLARGQLASATGDPTTALDAFGRALGEVEAMRAAPSRIERRSFRLFAAGAGTPEPLLRMIDLSPPFVMEMLVEPAEVLTRLDLGLAFQHLGKLDEARRELVRAMSASRRSLGQYDGVVRHRLGSLERRAENLEKAREHLTLALAKQPPPTAWVLGAPRVSILAELREVEVDAGRIDEALALNRRP